MLSSSLSFSVTQSLVLFLLYWSRQGTASNLALPLWPPEWSLLNDRVGGIANKGVQIKKQRAEKEFKVTIGNINLLVTSMIYWLGREKDSA